MMFLNLQITTFENRRGFKKNVHKLVVCNPNLLLYLNKINVGGELFLKDLTMATVRSKKRRDTLKNGNELDNDPQ